MAQNSWYSNDVEHVLKQLDTSIESFSQEEAEVRLKQYGPNEFLETGGINPLKVFLQQFKDPLVMILITTILISLFVSLFGKGHEKSAIIDTVVISVLAIFNAVFSFLQENKSEQALEALSKMAAPKVRAEALSSSGGHSI